MHISLGGSSQNQGLDSEWDNFGKMMSESNEYKDAWGKLTDDQKNNLKDIYDDYLQLL